MNSTASALPLDYEVQSRIRKVQAFGRNARAVCAVIFWSALVAVVALPLIFVIARTGTAAGASLPPHVVPGSSSGDGGSYDVLQALLSPVQLMVTVVMVMGIVMGVWLAVLRQLHRLFGNLAAGAIFTSETVGRVRNVGRLLLLWAVLGIVIPAAIVIARGVVDASVPMDLDRVFPSMPELFLSFATAGLVLLASWIMDVGLYVKDHAEALQQDAELTI